MKVETPKPIAAPDFETTGHLWIYLAVALVFTLTVGIDYTRYCTKYVGPFNEAAARLGTDEQAFKDFLDIKVPAPADLEKLVAASGDFHSQLEKISKSELVSQNDRRDYTFAAEMAQNRQRTVEEAARIYAIPRAKPSPRLQRSLVSAMQGAVAEMSLRELPAKVTGADKVGSYLAHRFAFVTKLFDQ